jgi:hypothetical protein
MAVISYKTLCEINDDHNLLLLLDEIVNRNDRMCFERIIAILLKSKNNNVNSIYGDISKHIYYFSLNYNKYLELQKNSTNILPPAVKVWTLR